MTQEEILQYNKRCAEFLNLFRDKDVAIYKMQAYPYEFLKFYSDWNWIMTIKEKIVELDLSISPSIHRIYFNVFSCRKNHKEEFTYKVRIHSDFKDLEFKAESNDEKEAVVQAINQFLIWYNEKKD